MVTQWKHIDENQRGTLSRMLSNLKTVTKYKNLD